MSLLYIDHCLYAYGHILMISAWGFQCLSNFELNIVFRVGLGLSDASDEMNENIQGEPKVGIQYTVY